MRVMEDAAIGSREVALAGRLQALVDRSAFVLCDRLAGDIADLVITAGRAADNPIRPTLLLKESQALFVGCQLFSHVYQVRRSFHPRRIFPAISLALVSGSIHKIPPQTKIESMSGMSIQCIQKLYPNARFCVKG
jgi:hypothetical protein